MSLWVFAEKPVPLERELAAGIGGQLVRAFDGRSFWIKGKQVRLEPGDTVVVLSGKFPKVPELKVFNGGLQGFVDDPYPFATLLRAHNIMAPRVINEDPRSDGWKPRRFGHHGGLDLVDPPTYPDYWTERIPIVREFRIHNFDGRIIGAGEKIALPGAHQWVRTEALGWIVKYGERIELGKKFKSLIDTIMAAGSINFASIDLGEFSSGWVVLGVDRTPKLDARILPAYVRAFKGEEK